jgi:hypothetical protein
LHAQLALQLLKESFQPLLKLVQQAGLQWKSKKLSELLAATCGKGMASRWDTDLQTVKL